VVTEVTRPELRSEKSDGRRVMRLLLDETGNSNFVAESDEELQNRIRADGLDYVYREIELPIVAPIREMMANGILLDIDLLNDKEQDISRQLVALQNQINGIAGYRLNVNNHRQLVTYLFDELQLPVFRRTPGGAPSTKGDDLEALVDLHGVVKPIRDFRHQNLLHGWVKKLLARADRISRRIHYKLDSLGAVTGRFSCANLPLQSVPRDLLDVFVAKPGNLLIEADFSQIELRVLAHYSQEPSFVQAYRDEGVDIHRHTAALALEIPYASVTPELRNSIGKTVNFAIIYGITPSRLAEKLRVELAVAEFFLDSYLCGYPEIFRWSEGVKDQAWNLGYVTTLYGRRRRLPDVRSTEPNLQEGALRQAVNAVIQGTAADINKLALVRLHRALDPECHMLLTVHDSVLLEVPEARAREIADRVKEIMEVRPPEFSIPLKVNVHVGKTWGECRPGDFSLGAIKANE
jgi:DNA polymerase-1